jgi:peptide-methionine (S)-S-oxide reductase
MKILVSLFSFVLYAGSCSSSNLNPMDMDIETHGSGIDTATFGSGCFWCTEAVFSELKGVVKVIPGYAGGYVQNPSYEDICTGTTGHAEVCKVIFDTLKISYEELLEVFFLIHDPTSLNRQGNDVGTQYRSVIFYRTNRQKTEAEEFKRMLNASGQYPKPVVTEISSFINFFKAEEYHQQYFALHQQAPYCRLVVSPKMDKFRQVFRDKLKAEAH